MADETISSIEAPKPPTVNPISGSAPAHAATLKLKPVIRKPVIGGAKPAFKMPSKSALPPAAATAPAAAPAPDVAATPVEQLKNITQKLKGVTQQIPQQAILHKTGIIAEQQLTDAQKLASKSRTSRISLSDAIGASPIQNEIAPMKTIRIKRPVDLNSAPTSVEKPLQSAEPVQAATADEKGVSVTQRKTLKISRPGAVRPTRKIVPKKPEAGSADPDAASKEGEIADIPDIADIPSSAGSQAKEKAVNASDDEHSTLIAVNTILQFVACVAIALLGAFIYFFEYTRNWF